MRHRSSLIVVSTVIGLFAHATNAQSLPTASNVNVYQYAVENPVDDSRLDFAPTLGESVPATINLVPLDADTSYAYFYYNGLPVIVDIATRSVVRFGQ